MLRKYGWALAFVSVCLVSAAVLLFGMLYEQYNSAREHLIVDLNNTLTDYSFALECHQQPQWLRLKQTERCSLRHEDELTLLFKQNVSFLPWRIVADFSITPVYKGVHLDGQEGQWQLPFGAKRIHFDAQASGNFTTRKLRLNSWQMQGWLDLTNHYYSHIQLGFDQVKLTLQNEELTINNLKVSFDSKQQQNQRFIERSQLSFARATLQGPLSTLELHQFNLIEANLQDGKNTSVLVDAKLQGAKAATHNSDLRIDPTELDVYFDNLSFDMGELWQSISLSIPVSTNLKRLYLSMLKQMHENEINVQLDKLSSGLAYQNRAPNEVSISGDFLVDGQIKLVKNDSTKQDFINLNLDLSDSLMLGPQVDLMLDFVNEGWLKQRDKRLLSRILYKNGQLLANGRAVSALALWPPAYVEDH